MSTQDLSQLKRPQLWAIADELGVHRFARVEKLIVAISNKFAELEKAKEQKPLARIINDGDIDGDGYEPWVLVSDNYQIVVRGRTYLQVLNSNFAKDFDIANINDQTNYDLLCEIPQEEIPQDVPQDEISQVTQDEISQVTQDEIPHKGLVIYFISRLGKQSLYAVNIDGRLTGYLCDDERGSGRFSSSTMSPDNQPIIISPSADSQGDMPGDTDFVNTVTHEKLLLTIR